MWWKAWSGKWTVSKLLAKELWYEIVSIWDMKRKLAAEMWINIIEFNKMWDDPEKSAEFDLKYEEYQKNLKLTDNIILDSRLWFYAQPKAFKILLDVDEEIAWERIFKAERDTDKHASKKHAIAEVKERNLGDEERYKKLYDVDLWNPNNYNLVIDTSERTPEEVLNIILEEFKAYKWKKGIAETPEEKKALSPDKVPNLKYNRSSYDAKENKKKETKVIDTYTVKEEEINNNKYITKKEEKKKKQRI